MYVGKCRICGGDVDCRSDHGYPNGHLCHMECYRRKTEGEQETKLFFLLGFAGALIALLILFLLLGK